MGNYYTKNINKIPKSLYFSANKIFEEYNDFIENDNGIDNDNRHITGGISSGVSSSDNLTYKGINIKLWYDISYMDLLRGRYILIEEWVDEVNNLIMLDEDKISIDDIKNIVSKNNKNRNNTIIKDLKLLFESSKITDYNPLLYSFLSLVKRKEGRCTSGMMTFLNVLNENNEKILEDENISKQFNVTLEFEHIRPSDDLIYKKEKERIEKEIKSEYDKPILVVFQDGMKEGDILNIKYDLVNKTSRVNRDFEWKIPKNFLKDYQIGDIIKIDHWQLPDELSIEIIKNVFDLEWEAIKKIKKPKTFKKKYDISFNIGEFYDFKNKFINQVEKFILEKDEFQKKKGFGIYKI